MARKEKPGTTPSKEMLAHLRDAGDSLPMYEVQEYHSEVVHKVKPEDIRTGDLFYYDDDVFTIIGVETTAFATGLMLMRPFDEMSKSFEYSMYVFKPGIKNFKQYRVF